MKIKCKLGIHEYQNVYNDKQRNHIWKTICKHCGKEKEVL